MISNTNQSAVATVRSNGKVYLGVASVKVLAINPDNAKLRSVGWSVPDDADEPQYVFSKVVEGRTVDSARVRFLVQIQDLEDKPIIPLDFWIRPEPWVNREGTKCQIIDKYGRTAWGTKDEIKSKAIPEYSSGPANIADDYKVAHKGEEELVLFLRKLLNVTPLMTYDRISKQMVRNTGNPGTLTIDNWKALCAGDVSELRRYVAEQPENSVKVILGYQETDENRKYQSFINDFYLSSAASPSFSDGEYRQAKGAIERYAEGGYHDSETYSAKPVIEWVETPTEVKEDEDDDALDKAFDNPAADDDDLPF